MSANSTSWQRLQVARLVPRGGGEARPDGPGTLPPDTMLRFPEGEGVFVLHERGRSYLFAPQARAYCALTWPLLAALRAFDGRRTLSEIQSSTGLDDSAWPALDALRKAGILAEVNPLQAGQVRRPSNLAAVLALFPTTDCNLRCVYCYARGGDRPRELTPAVYRAAIDFFLARSFGTFSTIRLKLHGGGEVALNPRLLEEICAYFQRRCGELWLRPRISMQSNGVMRPRQLRWIIENDIEVGISLDGPPAVHNRQRPFRNGRPSFGRVMETVRALRAAGREVGVVSTVTSASLPAMPELVDLACESGIGLVSFNPLYQVGRSLETGVRPPQPDEFAAAFMDCFRRGARMGVSVTYFGLSSTRGVVGGVCGATGGTLAVTPDGLVTTCYEVLDEKDPAASTFIVGAVDGTGVKLREDRLRRLETRKPGHLPACAGCFLRMSCAGGCMLRGFRASGGDLLEVHPEGCQAHRSINRQVIAWLADGGVSLALPMDRKTFECGIDQAFACRSTINHGEN